MTDLASHPLVLAVRCSLSTSLANSLFSSMENGDLSTSSADLPSVTVSLISVLVELKTNVMVGI